MRTGLIAVAALCVAMASPLALACETPASVCSSSKQRSFPLIRSGQPASLFVDASADSAVKLVADSFAADLERVGGKTTPRVSDPRTATGNLILIGVLGRAPSSTSWCAPARSRWATLRPVGGVPPDVVDDPSRRAARAGDRRFGRRGAVFGTYDLSEKIGVSPWYWWADVPVRRRRTCISPPGRARPPKVRVSRLLHQRRGCRPSAPGRARVRRRQAPMYAHVFELILRLKGNYLWPAMWGKAFNDDDPQTWRWPTQWAS